MGAGRLLVIDDEPTFRDAAVTLLKGEGYECDEAPDVPTAMRLIRDNRYDLLIADIRTPGNIDPELLRELSQGAADFPVILTTRYPSVHTAVQAFDLGVVAYFVKPFDLDKFLIKVRETIDRRRAETERRRLIRRLEATEARFRTLLESAPDAVVLTDQHGVITLVNQQAEFLFGYHREELIGQPVEVLVPERLREAHVGQRTRYAAHPRTRPMGKGLELCGRHKNGAEFPVEISLSPVRSNGENGVLSIIRDIADRQQLLDSVRQSEERFRALVQYSSDIITILAADGTIRYQSPSIERILGYQPDELLGANVMTYVHPDDRPIIEKVFAQALRTSGVTRTPEFRFRHADGSWVYLEAVGNNLLSDRRVNGVVVNSRDVSDRRRAAEALRRSEEQLRTIVTNAPIIVYALDNNGVFTLSEGLGLQALGLRPGEAVGHSVFDLFQDVPEALTAVRRALAGETVNTLLEERGLTFEAWYAPLYNEARQQVGVMGVATDITARRQAERALQTEVWVSTALAQVGQSFITSLDVPGLLERLCQLTVEVLDGCCSCTFLWQPEEQVYQPVAGWGYTPEQWEIARVLKFPPDLVQTLVGRLEQEDAVAMGPTFPMETFAAMMRPFEMEEALCFALRRGRDLVGFQACGYARRVDLGSHHFRIAQGMSQLASLALMNARLLEGLEQSNRLKDDFVNTMSHELRTPLHILIGYTEMLLDNACGPLAPAQTETLRRMHKTAQELFNLINAILDLSRLQDSRGPLTVSEIPLAIFLEELCSEVRNRHAKPAVAAAWEVKPSLLTLRTDAIKLQMVLQNLLVNALKFTEQGSVKVTVAAERGGVSFLVQDTGTGIAPEDLPFIFEPFRQGGPFSTRTHGGVGLGLYIVRQLVELLGGIVMVDSEIGKGTAFYVWIPETPPP